MITASGNAFELEQFDILISALPNNVIHANNGKDQVDLLKSLKAVSKPTLILQPAFEPQAFRDFVLENLGVAKSDLTLIPNLAGLRPDIVFADARRELEHEVLPDGSRRRLKDDDQRTALCIIDLKNITEANASYSAEVCLYAIFLSNWLHKVGAEVAASFFVSDRVYLWRHVEMPQFTKVKATKDGMDHAKRLEALRADLEDGLVRFLIYMPSVRKFFAEDLPRVIRTGDGQGWNAVPYHVNPRCSSCDWLGNRAWLSTEDKKRFDTHPEHYCSRNAEDSDHLCKMPHLSKGASNVLAQGGHPKVATVVGIEPDAHVLKQHALLKKDRNHISARAESITQNATSVDILSKVGGLAKRPNAEYDIVVNFDAGSGFLTGIALRGILFAPFGKQFPVENGGAAQGFKPLGEAAFVVNKDNLMAEWAALLSFIEKLGTWLEDADKTFQSQAFGSVRTQICFWEVRQYEELCNAFGRHLLKVLDLPVRYQRALAWLFPAEELMEKADHICPNIIFLREIVASSVRLPQRFAVTLLGTMELYHHPRLTPRGIDSYFVEPLGNGIPRERIFEIWKSPTGTVQMFGRTISVTEAIERYGNVLKAHTWAIASITARLRGDLKDCIEGDAPLLSMSIPTGLSGVAYDSKLWDRWVTVSAAVSRTERLNEYIARPESLEASYKAIILKKLVNDHGSHLYEFEVGDDSTEAKIEEGDWCTLGIVASPGFPLQRAHKLGLSVSDDSAYMPMYKVILVKIHEFARASKRITISLEAQWKADAAFDAVMASALIPIGKGDLYLLEGLPYDDSRAVTALLKEIGHPKISVPAEEALIAMGSAGKKLPKGTGANPLVATLLWQGDQASKAVLRGDKDADALTNFAKSANKDPLNPSQIAAVKACAKHKLAIVWGPPGTGKTEMLVAFLHAVVREVQPRKILIAGPNYRAVEELSERLAANLCGDAKAVCDFFWLYSRSRDPKIPSASGSHLTLKAITFDTKSDDFQELVASLDDPDQTTIISTTAHIVQRLTEAVSGKLLSELFHVVVLDESSQIPVTLALRPMAALRQDGQLIVAGDHMQMPPIRALDPPKNAEYLVDSIQTYLIERFAVPRQALLVNYRSNQDLVDYAKSLGYPSGLMAKSGKKDLHILKSIKDVIAKLPTGLPMTDAYQELLVPQRRVTALIHDDPTSSQANELEAGLVAGLTYIARHAMASALDTGGDMTTATAFSDNEFFKTGIGIVTPHKAQKALVLRKLMALFPKADPEAVFEAVDTVERFQGSERDTIIVSYGVGDTDIIEGEEEFLLQLERTNVAVSRAKAKCIVLMPKSLAYHLPTDQKAAETSIALKSYLEEFCRNHQATKIEFAGVKRAAEIRWH
jgi:AAA domain